MNDIDLINELLSYKYEKEWIEFKVNFKSEYEIGEYISALSNGAASYGEKHAYLVWGIEEKTHIIVGTDFEPDSDTKDGEPLKHYLERNLEPRIKIEFNETFYNNKRIIILTIAPASKIPTAWNDERYIRIGSSKEKLRKFPEREVALFKALTEGVPTIVNTKSQYQDLKFNKLFGFFGSKGIALREDTFKENLGLLTEDGYYNIQAQLLSDNSYMPIRVSIFEGETKASNLFSIREFGYNCLLYSLDELIRYGDVLNLIQVEDERKRIVTRNETSLFESKPYNEAIMNAILHNRWVDGNEPMISVFSNRIEIMSRGTIPPNQTLEGFYKGQSVPVNAKLAEIFIQLHISEKSGRGIPTIISTYGKDAITINDNSIVVSIPFRWINNVQNDNNTYNISNAHTASNNLILNKTRKVILSEIRNNPNISKKQFMLILKISDTAVDKNIKWLKDNGYIERVGSSRNGYWKVIDK